VRSLAAEEPNLRRTNSSGTKDVGGPGPGDVNNMKAYFDELAKRRLAHAK
jgi:hypothetical protein